jgi:hypothetical protein
VNPYAGLVLAIIAAVLGAWLALAFADWNKQQACVTAGGRNCPGALRVLTR